MRFAYADPPYLGQCGRYNHEHHGGGCWDDVETHAALIEELTWYDGWALSLASGNLWDILPLVRRQDPCGRGSARVAAWVKPFGSFKPGVNPAYVWEPVIWQPSGRALGRDVPTVRDWVAESQTLSRGFTGAKPEAFTRWMLELLGVRPEDDFHDLFPGSGAVTKAYEAWRQQLTLETA